MPDSDRTATMPTGKILHPVFLLPRKDAASLGCAVFVCVTPLCHQMNTKAKTINPETAITTRVQFHLPCRPATKEYGYIVVRIQDCESPISKSDGNPHGAWKSVRKPTPPCDCRDRRSAHPPATFWDW